MDLRDFITETLVQIQEGVQAAIERRDPDAGARGAINPVFGANPNGHTIAQVQKVEFDVAVTATDKSGVSAKGGLKVWSVEFGGGGSSEEENSTVSRIKFVVPLIPPTTQIKPSQS